MRRTVHTPDGRVLAVEDDGDPAGRPVLVHAGTPNSRLLYGPHVRDAAERGLRLIGYDRPGYGGSSPQPGRSVADCAADVRAICAALGIDRLAMWGISGAVLTGELASFMASSMKDGLAPGREGWSDDTCAIRPWGFRLADITIPVLLLHGKQDMFVPFGHGEWLAAHIPGVEARLSDTDGHLTLMQNRIPEVHAWLSDRW